MINEKLKDLRGRKFVNLEEIRSKLKEHGIELPHLDLVETPNRVILEDESRQGVRFGRLPLFCNLASLSEDGTYSSLDDFVRSAKDVKLRTITGPRDLEYSLEFYGDGSVCLMLGAWQVEDLGCPE